MKKLFIPVVKDKEKQIKELQEKRLTVCPQEQIAIDKQLEELDKQ